jgi:hypothetical protein
MTAVPAEAPPLRISWSRIRNHAECRAKGALLAAGRKSPVTEYRVFFKGTATDRCMDAFLALDNPERGWMAAHMDAIFDAEEVNVRESGDGVVRWLSKADREQARKWCRECVTRLEPILFDLILPHAYEPHARFKTPLTIPGPGGQPRQILLTGETDLRTWRGEQVPLSVDDLKATEDTSYWRKVTGQLLFYEIATWGMTGRWPEVSRLIQPMCDQRVLEFKFTAEHRRQMFVTICNVANDIWRDNLPPKKDSTGCSYCPVKHACSKFAAGRGRQRASA